MSLEVHAERRRIKVTLETTILLMFGALAMGWLIGTEDPLTVDRSTIGANEVPADLDCEEDEVIGFDPTRWEMPRPLTCVHIDKFDR